jgi:sugar O-acyltransferase (sialic acid O-acetyltransferase NeuD family)
MKVRVPRLNANEDSVQLTYLPIQSGDVVTKGQEIASVQSTKAAVSIEAPCSGKIGRIYVTVNEYVNVDSILCDVIEAGVAETHVSDTTDVGADDVTTIKVTAKAKLLAAERNIDITKVQPVHHTIGVSEVMTYAKQHQQAITQAYNAVIVGAGGHAACLIDVLQGSGYYIVGCTDAKRPTGVHVFNHINVIGNDEILPSLLEGGVKFAFIGIGDPVTNRKRVEIYNELTRIGFIVPAVIAPGAEIGIASEIGPGTVVLRGATVGPRCKVGANVLVNQGSILCHDSKVSDHCHLAPGCIIAANCHIGTGTTIGMGATVYMGVSVGDWTLVHNNVAITRNISHNQVVER